MSPTAQRPLQRIEVGTPRDDARARALLDSLSRADIAPALEALQLVEVTTLSAALSDAELSRLGVLLGHPVSRPHAVNAPLHAGGFDHAIEVGFLPGVTDNVATTVRKIAEDAFGRALADSESVHSSRLYLLSGGALDEPQLRAIRAALHNPLIERATQVEAAAYAEQGGMPSIAPRVELDERPTVDRVDLEVDEERLRRIGREGIRDPQSGERRGPLALDITAMKSIQAHFRAEGRAPTDIELETIAQSWSEHCRHTIFNSPITCNGERIEAGLFRHYIRGATRKVREAAGARDRCVSVFADNAGAVIFDEDWLVCDKVETHNSPSALDPFGGAITGILGVNRDALGFGMGARPIINRYGFCLPWPGDDRKLFRSHTDAASGEGALLSVARLADGIFAGVEVGGNCSGIPTPQGFLAFHEGYRAKPLVFVGTLGLIPRQENGLELHEKKAEPGDLIVVVGGRVGLDGIHGATFSSEALAAGSPATAVQIGDPITQKLLSDALLREARTQGLYRSITDNGAGGLCCSVTEMGQQSGGCVVDLEKVPLKYPGMAPWQIWISESQERMTLAVPPEKADALIALFARRDVEATVIGEFTGGDRAVVRWRGETVLDLPQALLEDGWPKHELLGEPAPAPDADPEPAPTDLGEALCELLSLPGISTREELALRFDHEVQAGSVTKPLMGPGRVDSDATVTRPLPSSWRAVATSQALFPGLADIDPYAMSACAIDAAVRQLVAVGARRDEVALLDNFCWCSPFEPARIWQLHEAARACYDLAVAYGAPFVSGKDSMHNDFRGYDADGQEVAISVPPTLLISSFAVLRDLRKVQTGDFKQAGDHIWLLGELGTALGGSAWRQLHRRRGGEAPQVDVTRNAALYDAHAELVDSGALASSLSVGLGGVAVALARSSLAGELGARIALDNDHRLLFSETPGCLLVSCAPAESARIEAVLESRQLPGRKLGEVTAATQLRIDDAAQAGAPLLQRDLDDLGSAYRRSWREVSR